MFRSQSGVGVYSAGAESESKISDSVHLWYLELIEVSYYIIISLMASFMRVSLSQKLVFHQSKCISAIKHILSTTAVCMYLRIPSYICIFHVTASAMHV